MNEQSYELMVNCAKGAVMGKNALNSMANYVSGEEAKQFLLKAAAEHEAIGKKINEALEAENREPQAMSKMTVWFAEQGIKLKFYDIRNDGIRRPARFDAPCFFHLYVSSCLYEGENT